MMENRDYQLTGSQSTTGQSIEFGNGAVRQRLSGRDGANYPTHSLSMDGLLTLPMFWAKAITD
jgi:hypothetical protein